VLDPARDRRPLYKAQCDAHGTTRHAAAAHTSHSVLSNQAHEHVRVREAALDEARKDGGALRRG